MTNGSDDPLSRRQLLRTGTAAAVVSAVGLAGIGNVSAQGRGNDNGNEFGRIWVRGEQWRTHVIDNRKEAFEPYDRLVSILGYDDDGNLESIQASTSPNGPGDEEYNGGQWHRYGVVVEDEDAYDDVAPLTSTEEALDFADTDAAELVEPAYLADTDDFGGPVYFNCPLNGRA